MDPKVIDELARRLAAAVPESVSALGRDLEQNFKSVLQAGLARLDLVTRTEFDVQAGVLRRTRELLEAMDKRLHELEAELAKKTKKR
jgi:BMFP domain-containing protein YqiC